MSWLDRVKTNLVIQTGDGKKFIPAWINAKVQVSYNVVEFEFPEVHGTLVDRREQKGSRFDLQIFFQGENHVDQMQEFVRSSQDKRFWTITHPIYDVLTVQPLSLGISQEKYNVSSITIPIVQTITNVYPKVVLIIEDKIEEDSVLLNQSTSDNYAANVIPDSSDKKDMAALNGSASTNTANKISEDSDGQEFSNLTNESNSKILGATNDPGAALSSLQDVLNFPAFLNQSLDSRISIIKNNSNAYRLSILGSAESLLNITLSAKYLLESLGNSILTSMCLAASKPFDNEDYFSRIKVVKVIDDIQLMYNQYVEDLDQMQVGSGGDPTDYIANGENILVLNNLVNFTMGNLFNLALDAKQERILVLEDDTDMINLSHRLYGSDQDDSKVETLLRNNPQLGLNQILEIKKGTEIIYYI